VNRVKARKHLISEVNLLSAEEFHFLCMNFLNEKFQTTFLNTGINKDNNPLGYDVDIVSSDQSICAEVTVDKKSLTFPFKKINLDLKHCFQRTQKPNQVIVFNAQSISNIGRGVLLAFLAAKAQINAVNIDFYDANRLVDEMLLMIDKSDTFLDRCAEQLGYLRSLAILLGSEKTFPELGLVYKERKIDEDKALSLLDLKKMLLVHGISGVGKSKFTIKLKNLISQKFDYKIWLSGSSLAGVSTLNGIELDRKGARYGIAKLMASSNVLLCIDSLEDNDQLIPYLAELEKSEGTCIIITSQKKIHHNDFSLYELKGVERSVFGKIIDESRFHGAWVDKLFSASEGHPLVASLIYNLLDRNEITPEDIGSEIDNIANLATGKNETLVLSIFKNHTVVVDRGLKFIDWVGSQFVSKRMMKETLGMIEITKLKDRGFINDEGPDFFKIHELIFNVIQKMALDYETKDWELAIFELFKSDKLNEFEYYQITNYHFDLLYKIAFGDKVIPEALYLVASIADVRRIDDFNNFRDKFNTLKTSIVYIEAQNHEIMAMIEFFELGARFEKKKGNKELSLKYLKDGIEFSESYLAACNNSSFKSDVLHHLGKFKNSIGDYIGAYNCFLQAMAERTDFFATKLQAYRVLCKIDNDKDIPLEVKEKLAGDKRNEHITEILDQGIADFNSVSPMTLLAAFQDIRRSTFATHRDELLRKYENLFYQVVAGVRSPKKEIHLELLAGIGERFIQFNSDLYERKIKHVDLPSPEETDNKVLFLTGQIFKFLGVQKLSVVHFTLAHMYYDNIDYEKLKNDFELSHAVDFYNRVGNYEMAEFIFNLIADKTESFTRLRRSWTLYSTGKAVEAKELLEQAIAHLPAHIAVSHITTFEEQLNKISRGDPLATWDTWSDA